MTPGSVRLPLSQIQQHEWWVCFNFLVCSIFSIYFLVVQSFNQQIFPRILEAFNEENGLSQGPETWCELRWGVAEFLGALGSGRTWHGRGKDVRNGETIWRCSKSWKVTGSSRGPWETRLETSIVTTGDPKWFNIKKTHLAMTSKGDEKQRQFDMFHWLDSAGLMEAPITNTKPILPGRFTRGFFDRIFIRGWASSWTKLMNFLYTTSPWVHESMVLDGLGGIPRERTGRALERADAIWTAAALARWWWIVFLGRDSVDWRLLGDAVPGGGYITTRYYELWGFSDIPT